MRIGLIAMSGVRVRTAELAELGVTLPGFVDRGNIIASLPSLGLLTVAGLTPPGHELHYLEIEHVTDLSTLPEFDLVGISSLTASIKDAYRIADCYRARGTTVVMGGLHVTSLPDEALQRCDAVVIGSAEGAWERLIVDASHGHLQRRYHGLTNGLFSPAHYAAPRFDLIAGRNHNRLTVQTSRGCPRHCEFCAASPIISPRFNQKPVQLVIDEIRRARTTLSNPFFELADDNTFLDKHWGKEFLRALASEEIRWFTETDASVADDPELCALMATAGCRQVLIGFESPRQSDLKSIDPAGWKSRITPKICRVVDALQSRGVSVNGCFIVGLDNQTPEIFPTLRDFIQASGLAEVQVTVLTPFPGTPLYARLAHEKRLLNEEFWDRCTLFDVNFRPALMSAEELEEGLRWLFQELYSRNAVSGRQRAFVKARDQNHLSLAPSAS